LDQPVGRFCYRSGYLEFMKQVVDEQLAYGIDGFHIDMLDQGFGPPYGCWCAACQREFAARYGCDMPLEIGWDEQWERMLEFRYSASAEFEQALFDHIRRTYPDVTVDFNYHGNPPFSWEVGQRPVQHAVVGDGGGQVGAQGGEEPGGGAPVGADEATDLPGQGRLQDDHPLHG
ncbi:MAG: hypothetical protein KDA60_23290, partial [Planctomycetales bacterium]|nr:hypothetical protein [Planctomycetales bacterium]